MCVTKLRNKRGHTGDFNFRQIVLANLLVNKSHEDFTTENKEIWGYRFSLSKTMRRGKT